MAKPTWATSASSMIASMASRRWSPRSGLRFRVVASLCRSSSRLDGTVRIVVSRARLRQADSAGAAGGMRVRSLLDAELVALRVLHRDPLAHARERSVVQSSRAERLEPSRLRLLVGHVPVEVHAVLHRLRLRDEVEEEERPGAGARAKRDVLLRAPGLLVAERGRPEPRLCVQIVAIERDRHRHTAKVAVGFAKARR